MTTGDTASFDIVVVGSGAGGLTAAIRAHDLGLRVVVVEAAEVIGGATAFSGGQVWVGANHMMSERGLIDSPKEVSAYVNAIADARGAIDHPVAEQWIAEAPMAAAWLEQADAIRWDIIPGFPDYYYPDAPGSKREGRYLTAAPISGKQLGDFRSWLLTTPHFPLGVTYAELFDLDAPRQRIAELSNERATDDMLTFGTGIVAHLLLAAINRGIHLLLRHRATELVKRDGQIVGVVSSAPGGAVTIFGTVVLATGTYDWDPELFAEFSGLQLTDAGSVAPTSLRGDGIRLARQVGAQILELPADAAPHVPGFRTSLRGPYDRGFRHTGEVSLPHCFLVNRDGRRFCDDSFYRAITRATLGEGSSANRPFFLIWDENHHERYGLVPTGPNEPYEDDLGVVTAPTLAGVATVLGIDAANLVKTAERFSDHARIGEDPEFHRGEMPFLKLFRGDRGHQPNPVLGPVERPPFHGMRMRLLGTGIGAAGVRAGLDGRVLDVDGAAIPGLFAIGAVAAMSTSGTGYNSGFSLGRAITFGYVAAGHVARAIET